MLDRHLEAELILLGQITQIHSITMQAIPKIHNNICISARKNNSIILPFLIKVLQKTLRQSILVFRTFKRVFGLKNVSEFRGSK